jgi:PHS family inorganic phosphate transporter-like MFS transporter
VEADIHRGISDANTVITNDKNSSLEAGNSDVMYQAQQNLEARTIMPKHSWADFRRHFGQWKNFKVLFGAAWSWFALDIAFYGLGLNSAVILQTIGFGPADTSNNPSATLQQSLHNVAVGNIILAVGGLLPGYYFTFAFIDHWGRKPIQVSPNYATFALAIC